MKEAGSAWLVGSVWLVGMMGAGKSAVGAALAARLDTRFIDTDEEIERGSGRSISEIFAESGAAAFRALEREWIEKLAGERCVVALGGGAIAQSGAAERLSAIGRVVYLRARPETLLARIGSAEGRPVLAEFGPGERAARLRELLNERRAAYESASVILDTDALDLEQVVSELARRLEELWC